MSLVIVYMAGLVGISIGLGAWEEYKGEQFLYGIGEPIRKVAITLVLVFWPIEVALALAFFCGAFILAVVSLPIWGGILLGRKVVKNND